ncbi:hypothetical protein SI65_01634 [Aspergillus cristatus]|uniref:Uncharacterized protein n=1 Tax=Aspergillus cristatus TaxID=573508 RepID=A0A1E3BSU2_ASPCR|nr:hypothetical protein SI65_01634 [Aspergillus cristatus]
MEEALPEEIFPLSGFPTPEERLIDPFDDTTSVFSDPFDLDERDREERLAAYDTQRLRELVSNFARGFDAARFPDYVKTWIPRLGHDLFPGSYAHLMIILLEDWDQMECFQLSMFKWLCERHPIPRYYRICRARGIDDRLFVTELGVLKKLLSPLWGDDPRPIYWIGSRLTNPDDSCDQVKTSMRIIKHFKEEISAEIHDANDDRTIFFPKTAPEDHKAEVSIREFRIDACKASLGWGEFLKTDLHFTSFHQYYKAHLIRTSPHRARALGFLPPLHEPIPDYLPVRPDAQPTAWCNWTRPELRGSVLDLILKIAVWLGLARGAAAVHLFCDIVRAFSLKKPTDLTDRDRIALLYHFTAIRISNERITSGLTTPFSHADKSLLSRNTDYLSAIADLSYDHDRVSLVSGAASMEWSDSATLLSQKLPLIHRRLRMSQGQVKTYHDGQVLEYLAQASVEMTLSSKVMAEKRLELDYTDYSSSIFKRAAIVEKNKHLSLLPLSRPIPVPRRRVVGSLRIGYV